MATRDEIVTFYDTHYDILGSWLLRHGIYRRSVELASGRFAVIEKSREFTLVPWRPVLERSLGKQVAGIARGETISWALGRQRGGPSVS